jgi:hypothetical protein
MRVMLDSQLHGVDHDVIRDYHPGALLTGPIGVDRAASVEAGKSSHIWQGSLPEDLGTGTHRVSVRAIDEYGRAHATSMVLEVTG